MTTASRPDRLRILLIAEESAGMQVLKALARAGHDLVAVMTAISGEAGSNTSLAGVARQLGFAVWPARNLIDPSFAETVRAARIDIIVNVHSLHIIHGDVLRAARIGAFNMHPGRLPEYAGLNTVSWAIYQGESRHAVTVHWMVPEVDAGDIACQASFPIGDSDTALLLMHKCVSEGVPLVLQLITTAAVEPEAIPRVPQDLRNRRYYGKEVPHGGRLPWSCPARELVDFVRACDYSPYKSPWGDLKAVWKDQEIAIVKAARTHLQCDGSPGTVGSSDGSGVFVASGDEWISVRRVRIGGQLQDAKAVLSAGDVLAGSPPERRRHGSAGT